MGLNSIENLNGRGVDSQVDQTVGVSPLVVIPRNDLVEVVVEEDAGFGIDSGGGRVVNEVAGNDLVFGVSKNTLHLAFSGFLEGTKDFILAGGLFGSEGQVDKGNIGGRDL